MNIIEVNGRIYKNIEKGEVESVWVDDIDKENFFPQVLDLLINDSEVDLLNDDINDLIDYFKYVEIDLDVIDLHSDDNISFAIKLDDEFLGTEFLDYIKTFDKNEKYEKIIIILESILNKNKG